MSLWMDYGATAFGLLALCISFFGENFRNTDVLTMNADYGPASRWSGKSVFGIVGVVFLAAGFYELYHP